MTSLLRRNGVLPLCIVALALIYGSLFPLTGWRVPAESIWRAFFTPVDRIGFGDVLTNILIYVPLGFLAARRIAGRGVLLPLMVGVLGSVALSFAIELVQAYLPKRVSSFYDLGLNAVGATLGALIAVNTTGQTRLGQSLRSWRERNCRPGPLANLGLAVAALWMAAQLLPFVPSLDVGNLKQGLKPLVEVLQSRAAFAPLDAASYALGVFAIAIILRGTLLPLRGRSRKITWFIVGVLVCKIIVVGRALSLEALLGAATGLATYHLTRPAPRRQVERAVAGGLLLLLVVNAFRASSGGPAAGASFNWIPFRGHLANDIVGLADVLAEIWPYCALAYVAISLFTRSPRMAFAVGTLALACLAFFLEWQQRLVPGRLGDITDVVLSLLAWGVPWTITKVERPQSSPARRRRRRARKRTPALPVALVLAGAAGVAVWLASIEPAVTEQRVDESTMAKLPTPTELPPVKFAQFRLGHPRLPAPSPEDLTRLRTAKSNYLNQQATRARKGRGDLAAAVVTEFADPGSQDLAYLYERLLKLEFVDRGNVQVKPLALAYDWLYDRWTLAQRKALNDKLLDGCEHIIKVIREQRLSPYNVFLYNSPLQALVACSLATYQDSPRAEPVMRFTYDLWLRRVVPVWRQVMGKSGGWHEGGEYLGLGIGQAIYQVPAMWRHATGDDLFASEPGIRGFLDYLVYHTQPDGTDFRWGDAGFFNHAVPDRIPLALEFRHAGAYNLHGCPSRIQPTAWPWGPLPEPKLCDDEALQRLPRARFFDGIGLLVTRSDWSPAATYVTFKAGENFWSHTHLDQGAFTIFKQHPLAIDSGIYGSGYGSDHHMNYTYQTIAHNLVTVTDPDDTVPAPERDGQRLIANDGGQRRIGSGWGIEAAPLDVSEWESKREIYHTASILQREETPDYILVKADLTPAYTNVLSGKGSFSHRTRRVERFVRTFIHDRNLDAVVVYDQIEIANPAFPIRWLLHSQTKPVISDLGFDITARGGQQRPAVPDAGLNVQVMLPRERQITALGGPGFEFYVDAKNYDDNGKVHAVQDRRRDLVAGEWRVELQPGVQSRNVTFLVFMFPWAETPREPPQIECEEGGSITTCRISTGDKSAEYAISMDTGEVVISYGSR